LGTLRKHGEGNGNLLVIEKNGSIEHENSFPCLADLFQAYPILLAKTRDTIYSYLCWEKVNLFHDSSTARDSAALFLIKMGIKSVERSFT